MRQPKFLLLSNNSGPQAITANSTANQVPAMDVTDIVPNGTIDIWLRITAVAGATPGIIFTINGNIPAFSRTVVEIPEIVDNLRTATGVYYLGNISKKYLNIRPTWTIQAGTTSITCDMFVVYDVTDK